MIYFGVSIEYENHGGIMANYEIKNGSCVGREVAYRKCSLKRFLLKVERCQLL